MPKKEDLLKKLLSKPMPTNFTTRELEYQIKMIIKFLGEVGELS